MTQITIHQPDSTSFTKILDLLAMINQSENQNNNTGFQALRQDDTGQWEIWMPEAIQAVLPERAYFVTHTIIGKNELAVYEPERWWDLYWELNDAEHVHDGFARYVKTNRYKLEIGESSSTLQKFPVPDWFVRFLDGDPEDIVWGKKTAWFIYVRKISAA